MTQYRIEVPPELWKQFKQTLTKDDVINDTILEMIKERVERFKEEK